MAPKTEIVKSDDFQRDQEGLVEALERLSVSMRDLDSTSTFPLSHYRQLPEVVQQARDLLQTGATLIHGTSTKYTLLGKIDQSEQIKMSQDLLKGCQFIGTACLLLHERTVGSGRAFRRHVKQVGRALVQTVIQMIQAFLDGSAERDENCGAQKTGVVWQACDVILEKRMPIGNRNAIRRDLFTYMMECQETMDEFQQLCDLGPSLKEKEEVDENGKKDNGGGKYDDDDDKDAAWNEFIKGDEQYSSRELPVARACLSVVKISRGSINLVMQACEAVGAQLHEVEGTMSATASLSDTDKARLEWLENLFQMSGVVDDGMTDFGTNLYPPMELSSLARHVERQLDEYVAPVLNKVLDATLADGTTMDMPSDVIELANKLQKALANRRKEVLSTISGTIAGTTYDDK